MTNAINKQHKGGRNGLIELFRFLFALWVLYYHSYVPYKGKVFGQGYLAVEFFFVLSGFFLMRSMEQYINKPIKEGLVPFLKHRLKSIAIPFFIGEVFVLIYSFAFEISYNLFFGYLWYIRDLFLAMIGIFLIRKYIKKDWVFYAILAFLSIIAFFGFCWLPILAWPSGPFRSVASIPLGIFAALIPPVSKGEDKWKPMFGLMMSALMCIVIIILPNKNFLLSYVLVIIGYPSLIYFANQIHCNSTLLNWLGSLSFPIYAFQCILRVIEACGYYDNSILFLLLVVMVLCYSFIMITIKSKRQNKTQST